MTKTTTTARVRQSNLYTIERDGQPVAQAMAISQAEAVALWVASQQQPVLSARLSSPLEARTLAGLPLLSRDAPESHAVSPASRASVLDLQPERDPSVPDMFDDTPAAPESPVVVAAAETPAVCQRVMPNGQACGLPPGCPDCGSSLVDYPDPVALEVAAAPQWETVLSASPNAAPVSTAPAEVQLPDADEPTHAERMASAYAAGVELGKQGAHRWGAEFLAADTACTDGLTSGKQIDEVGAELRRGFDFGRASVAEQTPKQELERQAEQAASRRANGGKLVALYRNPADGQTWTGRGLKPRWLVEAIEAGRTQDEFLIDPA